MQYIQFVRSSEVQYSSVRVGSAGFIRALMEAPSGTQDTAYSDENQLIYAVLYRYLDSLRFHSQRCVT